MKTLAEIRKEYQGKLDPLDLELIIAHIIQKPREFVLAHPEFTVNSNQESGISKLINRRIKHEPLAYILGCKEFFGLDFKVDENTLIPRPETELLVELAIQLATRNSQLATIIDIGTGSGNIIISLAKNILSYELRGASYEFIGTDISEKALKIAKYNAKKHKVDKKIKFIKSNLLKNLKFKSSKNLIILANLPYLSKEIYSSTSSDVKKYEPKSALISGTDGLDHYRKLFQQIKKITKNQKLQTINFLEISPEQKPALQKLIKLYFPKAKIEFKKDLSGRWRIAKIKI